MKPISPIKDEWRVLVGRIDERLIGLDRSFTAHEIEDHARFELVFDHMKDRFDKIDKKLEILWDQNNRNQGAFGASRLIAGAAWAAIVLAASWFMQKVG